MDRRRNLELEMGKLPPQATEIEEAVLGSILLEANSFYLVNSILRPEYFYRDSHAHIYSAISSMMDRGAAVDMLTVVQELKSLNKLEEVGGAFYITRLTSNIASAGHIEDHAKIIADKYIKRRAIFMAAELMSMSYDDSVDTNTLTSYMAAMEPSIIDGLSTTEATSIKDVMPNAIDALKDRIRKQESGEPIAIPTPLKTLNDSLIGYWPGQMIIVASRPGGGKSAWSLACAKYQSALGFKPAFFSLEMSNLSLANRLIVAHSGVDPDKFRAGKINPLELSSIEESVKVLSDYNIYVSDQASCDIPGIKASVKKLVSKGLCDIVYIDYLQLVTPGDQKVREQQISVISREVKKMALEFNIPIVVMSQLNRDAEGKRPGLSNLRESGSLEQDCDVALFLHNPAKNEEYDDNDMPYDKYDRLIIVGKQRDGGTPTIRCRTNKSNSVYYDSGEVRDQEPDQRITQTDIFTNDSENPFGDFQKEFNTGSMGQNIFPD